MNTAQKQIPFPKRGIAIGFVIWSMEALIRSVLIITTSSDIRAAGFWIIVSQCVSAYSAALISIPFWYATMRLAERVWWQQVLVQILFAGLFVALCEGVAIAYYFATLGRIPPGVQKDMGWILFYHFMHYVVMIAVWYFLRGRQELRNQQERERELRLLTTQMELSMLKAQLNPHFLFNALNTVHALVGSSPSSARTVITGLADILRYALESDRREYVRLEEECAFVEKYLAIEHIRFGNRLQTRMDIAPEVRKCFVPPMILQPLVENAVKHGIAPKESGGTVSVSVGREGGMLALQVRDDGVGMVQLPTLSTERGGRGLAFTDARLRKMFGEKAGVHIESSSAGTTLSFRIPEIVDAGTE